jgi:perosamine synthetase
VLVPGLSWPSPAHAARRIGAEVALVDVDAATWNARPAGYLAARSERSRGAIVIDQFGAPAEVAEVAGALGLPVVEDAACAIGSHRGGAPCGSLGTISTLSFHPRKVVTTGEGGALLTDEPALAERARWLRNHGQRAAGVFALPAGNLRLTEMQAAMGLVQLEKLDGILAARRALGAAYDEALAARGLDVTPQAQLPGAQTNRQTYGVRLGAAVDRDAVIAAMGEAGIECGRLSYALGTLPSLVGARRGPQPVSEELVRSGLALPLHTRMREVDVARVVAALARALDAS